MGSAGSKVVRKYPSPTVVPKPNVTAAPTLSQRTPPDVSTQAAAQDQTLDLSLDEEPNPKDEHRKVLDNFSQFQMNVRELKSSSYRQENELVDIVKKRGVFEEQLQLSGEARRQRGIKRLPAAALEQMFRLRRSLPATSPERTDAALAQRYNLDPSTIATLRKYYNSFEVGPASTAGEEINAVWVEDMIAYRQQGTA
ncbi:hypothetical protein HK102_008285 [Quaeritorhiza haematococci]|nr:hypothetical protein HK102_008285 [Quaeritorhiza haematococci]